MPSKPKYHMITFVCILVLITASLISSFIYTLWAYKQSVDSLLTYLNASTYLLGSELDEAIADLDYHYKLFLTQSSKLPNDATAFTQEVGEFMFYHPCISNIYVIDAEDTVLYGINNNTLLNYPYRVHIDQALEGSPSYHMSTLNNQPFLQGSYPIALSDEAGGALVVTYQLDYLHKHFQKFTDYLDEINIYLIDADGHILTSSEALTHNTTQLPVPIQLIEQTLSYQPTKSFDLLYDTPLYGDYYKIEEVNWTLLVTGSVPFYFKEPLWISMTPLLLGLVIVICTISARQKKLLHARTSHPPSSSGNGWV